jgi:hypothetical protein
MDYLINLGTNASILYMMMPKDNRWKYYFPSLDTFDWIKVVWIKFITTIFLILSICYSLTWKENTRGKIIEDLSVKWIKYKKNYFGISKVEKFH